MREKSLPNSGSVSSAVPREEDPDDAEQNDEQKNEEHDEAVPGDTFFVPAGTIHAIGGGIALCEVQQHSDVTYRLYDYGRGRELHLDHAIAVSHLEPREGIVEPELLVECRLSRADRH